MDYLGDYEGWFEMPSYDNAAIAFGYGKLVEVKDNAAESWTFSPYLAGDFERSDPFGTTEVPSESDRIVRHYLFCSDERTWDDAFCTRFDRGVTAT